MLSGTLSTVATAVPHRTAAPAGPPPDSPLRPSVAPDQPRKMPVAPDQPRKKTDMSHPQTDTATAAHPGAGTSPAPPPVVALPAAPPGGVVLPVPLPVVALPAAPPGGVVLPVPLPVVAAAVNRLAADPLAVPGEVLGMLGVRSPLGAVVALLPVTGTPGIPTVQSGRVEAVAEACPSSCSTVDMSDAVVRTVEVRSGPSTWRADGPAPGVDRPAGDPAPLYTTVRGAYPAGPLPPVPVPSGLVLAYATGGSGGPAHPAAITGHIGGLAGPPARGAHDLSDRSHPDRFVAVASVPG
jgi:hypothetical protein